MTLRNWFDWDLMEGRTGWGVVGIVIVLNVLGFGALYEGWIDYITAFYY